jgi:hypothetical protein
MGVGAAVVRTDWLALDSVWVASTVGSDFMNLRVPVRIFADQLFD